MGLAAGPEQRGPRLIPRAKRSRSAIRRGGFSRKNENSKIGVDKKTNPAIISHALNVASQMMQAALNEAEASAVCGSAGIGRQAGLRCLCSTIDVRVQVPSPAPKRENPLWILSFFAASLRLASIRFAQICRREYPIPSGASPCKAKSVRIHFTTVHLLSTTPSGVVVLFHGKGLEFNPHSPVGCA